MSNFLSIYIKKNILSKGKNLVSFDEPFGEMATLLKGCEVTGVFDVGASNGRLSRRMSNNFPNAQVYGFEPNPAYEESLKEMSKDNPRFHPQYLALSDCKGQFDLNITASRGNTSLLKPAQHLKDVDPSGSVIERVQKVEVTTIDDWVAANDNVDIQVMKFDIQGNELKALKGAKKLLEGPVLAIYTEICFNPMYDGGAVFAEIDLNLRQYGFELKDIYRPKYGPSGLLMWANAIYLNTERIKACSV